MLLGEVIIWDTGRDDDQIIATSGIGDDSHREPVGKVQWVLDPDSTGKKYNVSTVINLSYVTWFSPGKKNHP